MHVIEFRIVHVGAEEGGERGLLDAKRKTARSCARPSSISQGNIGKKSSDFIETLGKKSRGSGAGEREEEGKTGKEGRSRIGDGKTGREERGALW
jgi:hypothetical protein